MLLYLGFLCIDMSMGCLHVAFQIVSQGTGKVAEVTLEISDLQVDTFHVPLEPKSVRTLVLAVLAVVVAI